MQIKVHWIIDGIADIEAETMEEAEATVDALLFGKAILPKTFCL